MSILFNATTSKYQSSSSTGHDGATFTICAWTYALGVGENSAGIVCRCPHTGTETSGMRLYHGAANVLTFGYDWSTTDGTWTFPATDNQWNAVALSYDRGSVTNDPVARVNFANATITETATPTLTIVAPSPATIGIGNNNTGTRTWDGRIQHFQYFTVILTAQEMDSALRRPGSIRRGLFLWLPMWNLKHKEDLSGGASGWIPSTAALANANGAPCSSPWAGRHGWRGNFTAAAAAAGKPWLYYAQQRQGAI